MKRHLLILILVVALIIGFVRSFQSDELPEDADEWGLVGGEPASIKSKPVVEKPVGKGVSVGAKAGRKPSATSGFGDKKIQFGLEHALGDSNFQPIGIFSGILRESSQGRQIITKLRLTRNSFSKTEKQAFEDLVKEDGFYTIRIPANLINPRHKAVLASMKARCLAAANMKERLDLYLDQGNLIGISYSPIGDCNYPRPQVLPSTWAFDSLIVTKGSEQAPRLVPSIGELQPVGTGEKVVEGEEGPKVVVEKTFWQKYWMYIIPFAVIVVNSLSQIAQVPEDTATGQGGGASAAPTQRIAGSSGARRR